MPNPATTIERCLQVAQALLFDPRYFWALGSLVILGDTFLTGLIIRYVHYTEIDWETYMVQVKVFLGGEHNYNRITGPTGPLVYPAGHVRLHKLLYEVTNGGDDVRLAQCIYGVLYLTTQILSCAIYNAAGNVPNWIVLLLPLSKRLHSIFVLRLFNDCWTVVAVQCAILLFQYGFYDTGMMFFSAALSVKMSVLLYLPGLLVILFLRQGMRAMFDKLVILLVTQTMFAIPFLREDPVAYLRSAFNLGRVFLYKWTVNWRLFSEEIFLSEEFAVALLIGHLSVLVVFGFRWCERDGGVYHVLLRGFRRPMRPTSLGRVTADYVATVLFTSNLIGILFARSLHYQFYSWYAHQVPFLAWRTKYPVLAKLGLLLGVEYAWNVFPSTPISSAILLACNALLLLGIWFGYPTGKSSSERQPGNTL